MSSLQRLSVATAMLALGGCYALHSPDDDGDPATTIGVGAFDDPSRDDPPLGDDDDDDDDDDATVPDRDPPPDPDDADDREPGDDDDDDGTTRDHEWTVRVAYLSQFDTGGLRDAAVVASVEPADNAFCNLIASEGDCEVWQCPAGGPTPVEDGRFTVDDNGTITPMPFDWGAGLYVALTRPLEAGERATIEHSGGVLAANFTTEVRALPPPTAVTLSTTTPSRGEDVEVSWEPYDAGTGQLTFGGGDPFLLDCRFDPMRGHGVVASGVLAAIAESSTSFGASVETEIVSGRFHGDTYTSTRSIARSVDERGEQQTFAIDLTRSR